MTHTPGPWDVFTGTDIVSSEGIPLGWANGWSGAGQDAARANARLMAAAPNLLEELMVWVADCPACPGGGAPCSRCDRARALIAQARGVQP